MHSLSMTQTIFLLRAHAPDDMLLRTAAMGLICSRELYIAHHFVFEFLFTTLYNVHRTWFWFVYPINQLFILHQRCSNAQGNVYCITCTAHVIHTQGNKQKKRQSSSSATRGSSSRAASRGTWPLVIGVIVGVAAITLGVLFVFNQHHVSSPLRVPPVISPDMVNTSEYQLRLWGTYRWVIRSCELIRISLTGQTSTLEYVLVSPSMSCVIFKDMLWLAVARSLLAGLMWFSYNRQDHSLRHTCEHDDRLPRYGWLHHDGMMYGDQEIVDHGRVFPSCADHVISSYRVYLDNTVC